MGHRLEIEKYDYFVLVGILIVLMLIIYGFYGFNSFLTGIEDKKVAALLVVATVVGIILVLSQRAGIIFANRRFY